MTVFKKSWRSHDIKISSEVLVICAGNQPTADGFLLHTTSNSLLRYYLCCYSEYAVWLSVNWLWFLWLPMHSLTFERMTSLIVREVLVKSRGASSSNSSTKTSKIVIISSVNGLSPGRRQAVILTNAGKFLVVPSETNHSNILIKAFTFSFKNAFYIVICKMVAILSRPQCVK